MGTLRPADYYDAALELISVDGFDTLTIAKVCARLRITHGSFYHHFGGLAEFESGLIGHWEREHGSRLVEVAEQEPDPVARLSLLKSLSVDLPHGAEVAIRAWSANHPHARESQDRVDAARIATVQDTLLELGLGPDAAAQLARTCCAVLVGAQQLHVGHDEIADVLDDLEAWVLARVNQAHG